jgi:lyso-ornithine lipid O-acyltransferase
MASPLIARPDASHSPQRLAAAAGIPPPIDLPGRFRISYRAAGLALALIVCVPFHYLWKALGQASPWPRLFLRAAAWIAGARVSLTGKPLRRDVVFLSNHIGWIDILAIAGASGSAFVAKDGIRTAPIVGWLASLNRTIYVNREDRAGVAAQIDRLREALAEIWSVTIFPEGTTDDGRSLLPFKSSLLKVLEPPPEGVMVQPLMLDYGRHGPEIGWLGIESGKDNALRVLARRGSFPLKIHFLEPFDPAHLGGRKAIAAEARARISAALAVMLGHPTPDFVGHDAWQAGLPGQMTPSPMPIAAVEAWR